MVSIKYYFIIIFCQSRVAPKTAYMRRPSGAYMRRVKTAYAEHNSHSPFFGSMVNCWARCFPLLRK